MSYNKYMIQFQIEVSTPLLSPYDTKETMARFEAGLVQQYGPDKYNIIEFREMSDEEAAEIEDGIPGESDESTLQSESEVASEPETIH